MNGNQCVGTCLVGVVATRSKMMSPICMLVWTIHLYLAEFPCHMLYYCYIFYDLK